MREYLLTAFPNPERKGCPDEEAIKALAERRASLSDPAMLHIASCSECYGEYRNYRLDMEEYDARVPSAPLLVELPQKPAFVPRRRVPARWIVPTAIAASLMFGLGGFEIYRSVHLSTSRIALNTPFASVNPVLADVDLFKATTLRGGNDEPQPLQEVTLPAAIVKLTVTLPRYSQSGSYTILIARDRAGKQLTAQGSGTASKLQGRVTLNVSLDLRRATPGAYFLATIRGSDNGTYYYPLKVR